MTEVKAITVPIKWANHILKIFISGLNFKDCDCERSVGLDPQTSLRSDQDLKKTLFGSATLFGPRSVYLVIMEQAPSEITHTSTKGFDTVHI